MKLIQSTVANSEKKNQTKTESKKVIVNRTQMMIMMKNSNEYMSDVQKRSKKLKPELTEPEFVIEIREKKIQ